MPENVTGDESPLVHPASGPDDRSQLAELEQGEGLSLTPTLSGGPESALQGRAELSRLPDDIEAAPVGTVDIKGLSPHRTGVVHLPELGKRYGDVEAGIHSRFRPLDGGCIEHPDRPLRLLDRPPGLAQPQPRPAGQVG